jgi:hypothetical protein
VSGIIVREETVVQLDLASCDSRSQPVGSPDLVARGFRESEIQHLLTVI